MANTTANKRQSHTIKVEDAFRKTDSSGKDGVERVIINLSLDSDSSKSDSSDDDSGIDGL